MNHHVQIRKITRKGTDGRGPWLPLTKTPLGIDAASELAGRIDRTQWQTMLVPVVGPGKVDNVELLDRLSQGVDVPEDVIARVKSGDHSADDVLVPLRSALFHAFENHQGHAPFHRFSTRDHQLEHQPQCRKGRAVWTVKDITFTPEDVQRNGDRRWFVLREMHHRARHLTDVTIPALGINAYCHVPMPRSHDASCTKCRAVSTVVSVNVEIVWDGCVMKREYRL